MYFISVILVSVILMILYIQNIKNKLLFFIQTFYNLLTNYYIDIIFLKYFCDININLNILNNYRPINIMLYLK